MVVPHKHPLGGAVVLCFLEASEIRFPFNENPLTNWPGVHLEVVQKHSCAGSFCNFLPACVTNALLCLSPKPQPHGTQHSIGMEFYHWQKHINCGKTRSSLDFSSWVFFITVMSRMNESLLCNSCCVTCLCELIKYSMLNFVPCFNPLMKLNISRMILSFRTVLVLVCSE